jgi:hypothetical protein
MPDTDDHKIPPGQERLHEILDKVVTYQDSLSGGRAVELKELEIEGILSPDDMAFLVAQSVTYKPHRISDFHALDMFHMPSEGGGCVFIGPGGPPLIKRSAALGFFAPIVDSFLRLTRPQSELVLHIGLSDCDGMAVAPEVVVVNLRGADWTERLPAIRNVAGELGFHIDPDPARTAAAVVALLSRGCGFTDATEIKYSAGALDEADQL